MKKTEYEIKTGRFQNKIRLALVTDLHGQDPTKALTMLQNEAPDYILMAGDIFERLDSTESEKYRNGIEMLRSASKIAPTFYSTGNHEDGATRSWSPAWKKRVKARVYDGQCIAEIKESGAVMLDDEFVTKDGIAFGGLSSGLINNDGEPNLEWIDRFCSTDEPKVLLCHHPEYYEKYLKEKDIDLIVSGHAHGGQWRFLGRGVFAPGQGIFPKYTYGVHDNRFVISTGLKKGAIPRFFNAPEIVFINIS